MHSSQFAYPRFLAARVLEEFCGQRGQKGILIPFTAQILADEAVFKTEFVETFIADSFKRLAHFIDKTAFECRLKTRRDSGAQRLPIRADNLPLRSEVPWGARRHLSMRFDKFKGAHEAPPVFRIKFRTALWVATHYFLVQFFISLSRHYDIS